MGRRFKVLAVQTALLSRELAPGEDPESPAALERDRAVLPRLERAWSERQAAEPRLIEEPDAVARLTTPLEAEK